MGGFEQFEAGLNLPHFTPLAHTHLALFCARVCDKHAVVYFAVEEGS
jgi:hypothetical protein